MSKRLERRLNKYTLISCIIPVYNGEQYLAEAIDSILAQRHRPIELIVVDDGSRDATADVVARYAEIENTTQAVHYIWQSNAGPAAARNRGLESAKGSMIAFLDADDLWHKDKLHLQWARFQARADLEASVTHLQNFWAADVAQTVQNANGKENTQPLPGYYPGTLLARRSLFDRLGGFDSTLAHSSELQWFDQAREQGVSMELMPEVLVYRRLHGNNRSNRHAQRSLDEHLGLLKKRLDRRRAGAVPIAKGMPPGKSNG